MARYSDRRCARKVMIGNPLDAAFAYRPKACYAFCSDTSAEETMSVGGVDSSGGDCGDVSDAGADGADGADGGSGVDTAEDTGSTDAADSADATDDTQAADGTDEADDAQSTDDASQTDVADRESDVDPSVQNDMTAGTVQDAVQSQAADSTDKTDDDHKYGQTDKQRQTFMNGNTALGRGDNRSAEAAYKQLTNDPSLSDTAKATPNYNLGCALSAQGKNAEAAEAFQRAADNSDDPEVAARAQAKADECSSQPPTPQVAQRYSQAQTAYQRGDYDIAAARFQQLADDPNVTGQAKANREYDAGNAYENAGNTDRARAMYQRAIDNPAASDEARQKAAKHLAQL
jgi:hypothetical protein